MGVNSKRRYDAAWQGLVLGAALDVINATDEGEIWRALAGLYRVRQAARPRWSSRVLAESAERAVTDGREWLEAALAWDAKTGTKRTGGQPGLSPSRQRAVRAAVLDALDEATGGAGYVDTGARFELVNAEPVAPPHSLVALALSPLFDDDADWRNRLVRCGYRNCRLYFLVLTKRSGQRFCCVKHSNLEHQYQYRSGH